MRYKTIKRNDRRIRRAFLFFPKGIGGEVRWLEVAEWEEIYTHDFGPGGYAEYWRGLRWINS